MAVPIPPTMRPTTGLCPGKAFVHANWATYMDKGLPDLPDCADCSGDDTCATGKWIVQHLHDHPEDSLGLVGGHALLVDAPPAVFELVGTEPVVAEDDAEAKMAGARDLDMKYFDAYLTLDIAVIAGAKVYVPNTQLAKPVASPYECDVVVYDKGKEYLAIVETAMGIGPEEEALLEEKAELGAAAQHIPPLALRIRKKHSSHMGLAGTRSHELSLRVRERGEVGLRAGRQGARGVRRTSHEGNTSDEDDRARGARTRGSATARTEVVEAAAPHRGLREIPQRNPGRHRPLGASVIELTEDRGIPGCFLLVAVGAHEFHQPWRQTDAA